MGYVIKQRDSFFWPVEIREPGDGQYEVQKIELQFKKLKDQEFKDMVKSKKSDTEFCKAIVVGWRNVKDEKGADIPFEQFAFWLENVKYSGAIVVQYMAVIEGIAVKNS